MGVIAILVLLVAIAMLWSMPKQPRESDLGVGDHQEGNRGDEDHSNVVFVDEPTGGAREQCIAWNCHVAGISHSPALEAAERMMEGTDWELQLERDPANRYDRNAIKVIGAWTDSAGKDQRGQIGWVPGDVASLIARLGNDAELCVSLQALIKAVPGRSPGVRMNIWSPDVDMLHIGRGRPRRPRKHDD